MFWTDLDSAVSRVLRSDYLSVLIYANSRTGVQKAESGLFAYDSITYSSAWEFISVSMCYSQGDGVNTSLSRFMYCTHKSFRSFPVCCVVIFRGTVMCYPERK